MTEPAHTFETHRHEVYGWAYRLLGCHHDAIDVAQDVFIRWADRPAGDAPAHPRAWLRRVTINRSIDVLRQRRRAGEPVEAMPAQETAAAHDEEALRDAVARGLRRLTDPQRSVLVAKLYDGLTFAEIAAEHEVAVPTVKTHYVRALASMRETLAPQWAPEGSKERSTP